MKSFLVILLAFSFNTYSNDQYLKENLENMRDYQARFGRIGNVEVSSFEPCVHKEKTGGWYDHCFFNLEGNNSFGEPVSDVAKLCAKKSHKTLKNWLEEDGKVKKAFDILQKEKGNKGIYIIVTDTHEAQHTNRQRSSLWTWPESNGEGYYFKFNIAISREGVCNIPSEEQVINTIKNWVGHAAFDGDEIEVSANVSGNILEEKESSSINENSNSTTAVVAE